MCIIYVYTYIYIREHETLHVTSNANRCVHVHIYIYIHRGAIEFFSRPSENVPPPPRTADCTQRLECSRWLRLRSFSPARA